MILLFLVIHLFSITSRRCGQFAPLIWSASVLVLIRVMGLRYILYFSVLVDGNTIMPHVYRYVKDAFFYIQG